VGQGQAPAAQQIRDTAAELLNLYARRALREGCLPAAAQDYEAFAESFGFEETPTRPPPSPP
jgi:transcription-repair coupling factor (superfamily II helicase)